MNTKSLSLYKIKVSLIDALAFSLSKDKTLVFIFPKAKAKSQSCKKLNFLFKSKKTSLL